MKILLICGAAALALGACTTSVPDSGAGVGFGDYDSYQAQQAARDAQLEGRTTVPAPSDVQSSTLGNPDPVIAGAEAALNGGGPVQASPSNPAPQVVENAAGISNENSFDAVSSERDIQADAQHTSHQVWLASEQPPPRPWDGQHHLSHRHTRQQVIHPACRSGRHPPTATRWTKPTPLT